MRGDLWRAETCRKISEEIDNRAQTASQAADFASSADIAAKYLTSAIAKFGLLAEQNGIDLVAAALVYYHHGDRNGDLESAIRTGSLSALDRLTARGNYVTW
jgi:hypothetical protein